MDRSHDKSNGQIWREMMDDPTVEPSWDRFNKENNRKNVGGRHGRDRPKVSFLDKIRVESSRVSGRAKVQKVEIEYSIFGAYLTRF